MSRVSVGVLIGLVVAASVAAWAMADRGRIARAFYDPPRDSFGGEVTEHVLKAIPDGMHHPNLAQTFASENFGCHRSQLIVQQQLWTCQRRAIRLNGWPHIERWIVEFECNAALAPCTIVKLHAEVRT